MAKSRQVRYEPDGDIRGLAYVMWLEGGRSPTAAWRGLKEVLPEGEEPTLRTIQNWVRDEGWHQRAADETAEAFGEVRRAQTTWLLEAQKLGMEFAVGVLNGDERWVGDASANRLLDVRYKIFSDLTKTSGAGIWGAANPVPVPLPRSEMVGLEAGDPLLLAAEQAMAGGWAAQGAGRPDAPPRPPEPDTEAVPDNATAETG